MRHRKVYCGIHAVPESCLSRLEEGAVFFCVKFLLLTEIEACF